MTYEQIAWEDYLSRIDHPQDEDVILIADMDSIAAADDIHVLPTPSNPRLD